MLTPSAPLGPLSFFSRLISFRRVGYPRRSKGRSKGLALVITTVAAAIFLAVSSHLGGGQDRQIIETVGAMVVSSLVGKAVSTVVSAAVEEAIVMDVFDQRNKCYESYLAHPWSSCREGFVAVSKQWTYLHCCPSEPSDCYAVSNCFGDGPCADGYVLVEEGGCRDVCCPADLSRSPCFESQKCFYDCPAEYRKVEAGSFLDMPLPESLSCADTCCPTRRCFASKLCNAQELAFLPEDVSSSAGSVLGSSFGDERDCPHGFEAIPLNTSSLPWEQQAAFKAADPFGCLDICCDEELLQEGGEAGGGEAAAATADVVSDAAAQAASMATSQAVSGAIGAVSGGG